MGFTCVVEQSLEHCFRVRQAATNSVKHSTVVDSTRSAEACLRSARSQEQGSAERYPMDYLGGGAKENGGFEHNIMAFVLAQLSTHRTSHMSHLRFTFHRLSSLPFAWLFKACALTLA